MFLGRVIEYLFIVPLLFLIDKIDIFIDVLFVQPMLKIRFSGIPKSDAVHSVEVERTQTSVSYRAVRALNLYKLSDDNEANLYEAIEKQAINNPSMKIIGQRHVLSIDDEKQSDGRVLKKYTLANKYAWITYNELLGRIESLANGLLNIGLKSNDNIVIFAETRPEWLMCAIACFKIKVPIVTLYSTLGLEALAYGINETKVSYLITSGESVLKLQKIMDKCENLKNVIVISDKLSEKNVESFKKTTKNINVWTIEELEEIGKSSKPKAHENPKRDDLAIVMYTSGSTGNPKGVMMSHGNFLTSIMCLSQRFDYVSNNEVCIAYLPLAHVLELSAELAWLIYGVRIGYSSPYTLTDTSTGIKRGQMGDIRVLKPTFIFTVPLVLERIKKAVEDKVESQSNTLKVLFQAAYELKLGKIRRGQSSILLDKIVFGKLKSMLGGRLGMIVVGSSMLSRDVQEFAHVCLCPLIQAYGLTETCAASATQFQNETATIGEVGSVAECCELRLVDWPEGGYRCTDKPNPRGEIWIGGDNVALGYYNMPEKTKEDFRVIDGIRFFATGDIGEITPIGNLIIIDRKKDLVKLQGGEYVSLNKVETIIKLMPLVDNCCLIANPLKTYCVCLINPNVKKSIEYLVAKNAQLEINIKNLSVQEQLNYITNYFDANPKLRADFSKDLFAHCLKQGLERFEIPTKAYLVKEIWLPDTGLVTDSFKLKRKEIELFYAEQIKSIYS